MPKILKNILRLTLLLLIVGAEDVYGQDAEFTQFYSAPINLNPALTGAGRCSRAIINYRNQWNGAADRMGTAYETYMFTFDGSLPSDKLKNFGFGFSMLNDNSGSVPIAVTSDPNSTNSNLTHDNSGMRAMLSIYKPSLSTSYRIPLGMGFKLQAGFLVSYVQPVLRRDRIIFEDQIDAGSGYTGVATSEDFTTGPSNISGVMNYETGIALFNQTVYGGVAIKNLTEPTPTSNFLNGSTENLMKRRITVHGGALLPLSTHFRRETYIGPEFLYTQQGTAKQINVGVYWSGRPNGLPVYLGAWLRHTISNGDALVPYGGITIDDKLKLSVSYDITLSQLNVIRTGGTPELALTYNFCSASTPRTYTCPRFY